MNIQEIQQKLETAGVKVTEEQVKERFDLLKGFGVPEKEMERSVTKYFAQQSGVSMDTFYQGQDNAEVKVETLKTEGTWCTLRVKIIQLWDATHESVGQTGLAGDETGTVKFTKWAKTELPEMEEGKCYLLKNVVTSMYNDKVQVSLNKRSAIEPVDNDIEVGYSVITVIGALVNIQDGSGLIKRCPECNRSLRQGVCATHGKVDGIFDIRIKGSIDDGVSTVDILLNTELTTALTGISLDEAKKMATEALDQVVVLVEFKRRIMYKFFIVTGSQLDRFILTDTIDELKSIPDADVDALLSAIPEVV